MKTRHGFVSNSSTTSFCIYGVAVEFNEVVALIHKQDENEEKEKEVTYACDHEFDRKSCKFCPECGESSQPIEEDEVCEYDDIEEYFAKLDMDARQDCEGGYWYIGCDVTRNFSAKEKVNMVANFNEQLAKIFPHIEPEFHLYVSEGG